MTGNSKAHNNDARHNNTNNNVNNKIMLVLTQLILVSFPVTKKPCGFWAS